MVLTIVASHYESQEGWEAFVTLVAKRYESQEDSEVLMTQEWVTMSLRNCGDSLRVIVSRYESLLVQGKKREKITNNTEP